MCEKKYIQQLEQYKEDMIKDLQTLVRIKSVDELGIDGDPVPFGEGVQEVFQATFFPAALLYSRRPVKVVPFMAAACPAASQPATCLKPCC